MKTHFAPFTDLDDLEQAPCGTWLGDASELSSDWAKVDCLLCQKRKEQIIAPAAAEDRAIVEQMGRVAAFMSAECSKCTFVLQIQNGRRRCDASRPQSVSSGLAPLGCDNSCSLNSPS